MPIPIRDCAQRGEEARLRASVSDCDEIVHRIVKQYEDAHHDGDVVVAEDNDRQRHRIQRHASVFDKAVQSQHTQRQKHHSIEPHEAPVVTDGIGTERVHDGEEHGLGAALPVGQKFRRIVHVPEVDVHEASRQPDLDQDDDADAFHEQRRREQDQQQIQRTCPVV